ncbi:SDR family NAD(P)-dependent oxidoreductase [Xanthocytophaga agilis]|uniref:SDR family oxidoreductase n=1 Tax=Xanthocytophaga agilis TaxID=3048010 RepID=A0AAE3R999_9BACT|nr:SDR family oxidoreductase [Xanthocytophaga agilis]MDJ1505610.1 SDR family oxidoreductase [Xanthocytophaga agilis]
MTTNKIALVTGGSRGIGKDIALSLAKKGTDVIITYHSQQTEAESVVTQLKDLGRKAAALRLNTADTSTFDAFYTKLTSVLKNTFETDHFDFLINNAGTSHTSPIATQTEEEFDQMYAIHLKGVFFLTQKMLPLLNNAGRVINMSSAVARISYPGVSAYSIMKGGMDVFTRNLAAELGPRGITVNSIAPGAVFGGGAMTDTPEMRAFAAQISALGRIALPDDIGGIAAFLCSEDARWINGQRIEATGGVGL